jgi:tetratricopeptide (TPR) repeat protein
VAVVSNAAYWRRAERAQAPAHPAPAGAPPTSLPSLPLGSPLAALPAGPFSASLAAAPGDARTRERAALARHLALRPRDTRARFRLAQLHFQAREYDQSLAELRSIESQEPKNPNVFLRQAVVLKYAGEPERAERAVRAALKLQPEHAPAQEWLGEIYLDQGRAHQALVLFERCLKRQPDSFFALLGKGRALEQLLQSRHPIPLSRVIAPVEKAVALKPEHPEGLATLARMRLTYQNRLDDAEQLAREAASRAPERALPHLLLAQVALARPPSPETLQRAGEHAFEAGRRDPEDPRPPFLVGRVALQQNDVPRAIRALELSLARGPMPESVSQLAVAYRRAGDPERAERYAAAHQRYTDLLGRRNALLAARERKPREIGPTYALVELYLEADQPETAEQWLAEAKRLRPRDPRGDRLAARIQRSRREERDAPLLPIP